MAKISYIKNKLISLIVIIILMSSFVFLFSACGNKNNATIENVVNATITEKEIFMWVSSDIDSVSLSDKVKCSNNSTWQLYFDNLGQTVIPTKIATGEYGKLRNGDNIFYIVVNSKDGTVSNTYQLIIHRSYSVAISYYDNGKLLRTVQAYTGKEYIVNYVPNLIGYTFNGWKTSDGKNTVSITPWEAINLYIDKTAETFITTLDVNGGHKLETEIYELIYGEPFTLPIPKKDHYDFQGWYAEDYQFTNSSGDVVCDWSIEKPHTLTAKWKIQQHLVILQNNIENAGTLIGGGLYDHNSSVELKAVAKNGYSFKGWFNGSQLVSTKANYIISLKSNITLTAQWEFFTVTTKTNNENGGTYTYYSNDRITYGETVSLDAVTNIGYVWCGWYNSDNELVSKDSSYNFMMTKTNATYIAKWEVADAMANFNFQSSPTTCEVISVINKNITEIIIPDFVTSIKEGALSGCGILEKLTIPFVGRKVNDSEAGEMNLFGYMFGKVSFNGGVETIQKHKYSSKEIIYYIPKSLNTIKITSEKCLLDYAFYNCVNIKNIILPNTLTKISENVFYHCESLVSITIPQNVTYIGMFSFLYCKSLTSIIFEDPNDWIKSNSPMGYYGNSDVDLSNSKNNIVIFVGDYNSDYHTGYAFLKKSLLQ